MIELPFVIYADFECLIELYNLIIATDDKIRDDKPPYDVTREAIKSSALSPGKVINMNILQVKKYYLLIKDK